MQNKEHKQEHRVYTRMPFHDPLQFRICAPSFLSELHLASSRNVSQSGLCFISEMYPPVGTIIMIKLDTKTLLDCLRLETLLFELDGCILGKVVWSKVSFQDPIKFDVGIVFIKAEDAESTPLKEALDSFV